MNIRKPFILLFFISSLAFNVNSAELTVNINHIKSDEGTVLAQLFLGEDNYKNNQAQDGVMMKAKTGAGQFKFKDLEPGDYVVRLYHDENDNRQLDTNAFGMPIEGYAFSNEAVGNMGPPQYKDMVVTIKEADAAVKTNAKMTYL